MKKIFLSFITALCVIALVSCNATPDDIVLTSAKTVYSENVESINVIWQNNTEKEINFGNMFELEKKEDASFEKVPWQKITPETEITFTLEAHRLLAGKTTIHTYNLTAFQDIEKGKYRINTNYSFADDKTHKQYPVYFEFEIK